MANKYIFFTVVWSAQSQRRHCGCSRRLLKERGFSVRCKNSIPISTSTRHDSPYQHGESMSSDTAPRPILTSGHYERFIDTNMNRVCNVTTGRCTRRSLPRSGAAISWAAPSRSSPHHQ